MGCLPQTCPLTICLRTQHLSGEGTEREAEEDAPDRLFCLCGVEHWPRIPFETEHSLRKKGRYCMYQSSGSEIARIIQGIIMRLEIGIEL